MAAFEKCAPGSFDDPLVCRLLYLTAACDILRACWMFEPLLESLSNACFVDVEVVTFCGVFVSPLQRTLFEEAA